MTTRRVTGAVLAAATVLAPSLPAFATTAAAEETTGHVHGGLDDLAGRFLESGVVAAPFLAIVTVMVVANRRANRLVRDGARRPHDPDH